MIIEVWFHCTRIPIALPHLSIKLGGTRYWSIDSCSFASPIFSEAPKLSVVILLVAKKSVSVFIWWLGFLNSRKLSTGSQDWSKLSQLSSDSTCLLITAMSSCPSNGPGDHRSWLLKCWHLKEKGFLFACKVN